MRGRFLIALTCLAAAIPSYSQVGHPAKGSWSGVLDPVGGEPSERIRLLIDAQNGELSGEINPGRQSVEASRVELDAPNWVLTIEAETPEGALELVGTLDNLGSWTNRKYHGLYTRGEEQGTFEITLN